MNTTVCAATDAVKQWTDIDWKKAEYYVKKLQIRIVKAYKEGKHKADWYPDACNSSCLRVSLYNSSHKTLFVPPKIYHRIKNSSPCLHTKHIAD